MILDEERPGDDVGDLFDGGGTPLTDHDAESQLVGYLLHRPAEINHAADVLHPSNMHDPFLRRLYELLIHASQSDTPITIALLVESLGGEKSAGELIAKILADADLGLDVGDVADHLATIGERRMVGTIDDKELDYLIPFKSRFGGQRWEEIDQASNGSGYAWFVEDVIPMGEISLVFGDSGSGKSFDMFDMAMAGARGIKWNGRNVEPGLVVYVAAEAGKGFTKRKKAYVAQHHLEPSDPLPFYLCTKRPNFFCDDRDAIALIEEIRMVARNYAVPLVCIIMDTLSALAPGMNENASQDVSMVRKRLVMMQDAFTASIILVHHKPKGGSTPRGHGSLTGDFETTIEFETLTDRKRATVRKQREGKSGLSWEFSLSVVEVGRNKWNNAETSCVVVPFRTTANMKPTEIGFHATSTEMLFMAALWEVLIDHPLPPPAGLPKEISKVADLKRVRALMRERYIPADADDDAADGRFRVAFKRAGDKLRDGAVIGIQGELLWCTGKRVNGQNGAAA